MFMWKRKGDQKRRHGDKLDEGAPCERSDCPIKSDVDNVLNDFTRLAEKLTNGQVQMQLNLAKLTEAIGGIKRIDGDVNRLEDKVDKNSQMLWKVVGIFSACATVIPIAVGIFLR